MIGLWPPNHLDFPLLQPAPLTSGAGSFAPGPVAAEISSLAQLPDHNDHKVEVCTFVMCHITCVTNRRFHEWVGVGVKCIKLFASVTLRGNNGIKH